MSRRVAENVAVGASMCVHQQCIIQSNGELPLPWEAT
jgi:hypothetical protein